MGAKVTINIAKFKEELRATTEMLGQATRPAAQAGAQIIYDRAKQIVATELVSDKPHYFYGKNAIYGPYQPGTLRDSIYQAFADKESFTDTTTYRVSWNKDKAPYGHMVEFGTRTAEPHSFIGRAIAETRSAVREAIKQRYIEEIKK